MVKQPGREAGHSPLPSVKVKNARSYTSTRPYVSMAWCLVKTRRKLQFARLDSVTVSMFKH